MVTGDVIHQFRNAMRGAGLNTSEHLIADGKLHRFHVEGDPRNKRNGWYVLHLDERPAGVFGCNKRMGAESVKWTAKGLKRLSVEERRELMAKMKADTAKRERAKRTAFDQAAARANTIWDAAAGCESHPYLTRKSVQGYGLRVTEWVRDLPHDQETGEVREVRIRDAVLVPIKNAKNEIVSLQAIFPSRDETLGRDKDFLPGGEKRGCYYAFALSAENRNKPIVIAEGYATAASIHEATGFGCVVAFDAGNLQPVAEAIRKLAPAREIIIAADNDQFTKASPGSPENPGVHFAMAAGKAAGAFVAIPQFKELDDKPTDFNDLASHEGWSEVSSQVLGVLNGEPAPIPEPAPEPDTETVMAPEAPLAEETEEEKKARLKRERAEKREAKIAAAAERARQYDANPDMYDPSRYFTLLGHDRTKLYVYSHEMKLVVCHNITSWNKHSMLQIARPDFWRQFCVNPADDVPWDFCENWLIAESYRKGFYDPGMTRGRGAWMDEGRIVYHFGNKLLLDDVETPVTKIKSKFVYEQGKLLPAPADEPLSDEDGRNILDIAKMFRWTKPGSAVLMAGWAALAPICGALKWRPHIWITGAAGSGKTTALTDYLAVLTAGTALFAQGSSTEAGIRQQLQSDALPVLFDESEQQDEKAEARVQNVIALSRQASSESGAKTYKGSVNGEGVNYNIRSMFALSSIGVTIKNDADRDRLTVLALKPRRENDGKDRWPELKEALYVLGRDDELPGRLIRRSIQLLPVTLRNIEVFVEAAAEKFGSQREGDQYGALIAGAWSLVSDQGITLVQAGKMIDRYDWSEHVEHTETDDSEKALSVLLSRQIKSERGDPLSVYELISVALGRLRGACVSDPKRAAEILRRHGIIAPYPEPELRKTHFFVASNSPEIGTLLIGSPCGPDFNGQLKRLRSAVRPQKTHSINGTSQRGYLVPLPISDVDGDCPELACELVGDVPF